MENKRESILKGIISLLISQVFIKIIGLIYKLYLTNREGFGDSGNAIYSSGFQIYALLLTFSSTGVPNAISYLVSERLAVGDNKGAHKIFKIAFVTFALIGIMGSLLLFVGAETISDKWIQIPEAKYSLIALSPSIFFVSITSVIRGYFNGRQSFSVTAKSQTIEQIFKTVFTFSLVELVVILGKQNTEIMAASANMATTVATVSSFIYIFLYYRTKRREIGQEISETVNYKPTRIRKTLRKIINVAIPISISSLISSFGKNIDSITIVRFLKNYLTEQEAKIQYGILSGKIDSLCSLPFAFNVAFVTTLVPSISKSMAKGDLEEVAKKAEKYILISILIAFPIASTMFIYPNEILKILFPNAPSGAMYLKISSITIVFMLLAQTINGVLQGIGKVNIPAISFGIGMIVKFLCNIILIPNKQIGIYGAIIGNILCNILACIISSCVLIKNIKLKINLKNLIIKPLLATICINIISIVLYSNLKCIKSSNLAIIVTLMVSYLIYLILIIIFRIYLPKKIKIKNFS